MGKELKAFWKVFSICSKTWEFSKVLEELDFGENVRKLIQAIYDLAVPLKLCVTLFASTKPLGSKMGTGYIGTN
jgi:hypothetical protein